MSAPLTRHIHSAPIAPGNSVRIESRVAYVSLQMVRKRGGGAERLTYPEPFVVDPGAGITKLSLQLALLSEDEGGWDLDVGTDRRQVLLVTAAGRREVLAHYGSVRVKFPSCDERFEFKCLFVDDWPPETPPLLGLHDVLDFVRITFDKTPVPRHHTFGNVIFERYDPSP